MLYCSTCLKYSLVKASSQRFVPTVINYWLHMIWRNRCPSVKSLRKKVVHLSKMLLLVQLAGATGPKQGMRCTLRCKLVNGITLHILVPSVSLSAEILNILWFRSCVTRGEYHSMYARWLGTSILGLKRWAWIHGSVSECWKWPWRMPHHSLQMKSVGEFVLETGIDIPSVPPLVLPPSVPSSLMPPSLTNAVLNLPLMWCFCLLVWPGFACTESAVLFAPVTRSIFTYLTTFVTARCDETLDQSKYLQVKQLHGFPSRASSGFRNWQKA